MKAGDSKYMREYNKKYKQVKRLIKQKEQEKYNEKHLVFKPSSINFNGTDIDEPYYCLHFGCGRKLSLEERRFGNKCINHHKGKSIDVAKFISHPLQNIA